MIEEQCHGMKHEFTEMDSCGNIYDFHPYVVEVMLENDSPCSEHSDIEMILCQVLEPESSGGRLKCSMERRVIVQMLEPYPLLTRQKMTAASSTNVEMAPSEVMSKKEIPNDTSGCEYDRSSLTFLNRRMGEDGYPASHSLKTSIHKLMCDDECSDEDVLLGENLIDIDTTDQDMIDSHISENTQLSPASVPTISNHSNTKNPSSPPKLSRKNVFEEWSSILY